MGIEAVQEPVGVRLDAWAQLAMRKQREPSMAWVVGVFITIFRALLSQCLI
jgi:hypothetical protein